MEDYDLIQKYIQKNDHKAFEELYKRYVNQVFRFVYSRTGNKDKTQDIVSETFITLLEVLKNFDLNSGTKIKTFIIGIAFNKMKQAYYTDSKEIAGDLESEEEFIQGDLDIVDEQIFDNPSENIQKAKEILNKLDSPAKEVIICRLIEGKTVSETSKILNLTESNVRVIHHRALESLKKEYNVT